MPRTKEQIREYQKQYQKQYQKIYRTTNKAKLNKSSKLCMQRKRAYDIMKRLEEQRINPKSPMLVKKTRHFTYSIKNAY